MSHIPMNLDLVRSAVRATSRSHAADTPGASHGVVTIARESGTGAPRIAARVCELLNERHPNADQSWIAYDKNLMERVAKENDLEEAIAKKLDEHDQGILDELFASFTGQPTVRTIGMKTARTVRGIGRSGRAVVVGRGGAAILAGLDHALHVRLKAPLEWRARQWARVHDLSIDAAREQLVALDHDRSEYFEATTNRNPDDLALYDLVIDVQRLTAECTAQTIARAVEELHLEDD